MKRWLAFLFALSAVWILAATSERKVICPFAHSSPAPVSGQQISYAYDTIGNRQSAGFGGDTNGANLRTITYTNNSLNQYIGITTPGYENIIGAALTTNSVSVNGNAADRK